MDVFRRRRRRSIRSRIRVATLKFYSRTLGGLPDSPGLYGRAIKSSAIRAQEAIAVQASPECAADNRKLDYKILFDSCSDEFGVERNTIRSYYV
jgi:hypothetical protein